MLKAAKDTIFNIPMPFPLQMFLIPSLITMSIAATRIYRSLADFMLYSDMYGTVSFHHPQELILVGITVAEMVRITPRRSNT